MKVTKVDIRKLLHEGTMRAIVSVTLDDAITIHEVVVLETTRFFVGFPSRKDEVGKYRDIVHPINAQIRMLIEGAVLCAYRDCIHK